MNELERAKEKYNSIEIPQELDAVVNEAIKASKRNKERSAGVHYLRIAPVAACALICFVIGISAYPWFGKGEEEIALEKGNADTAVLARNAPSAGSGMSEAMADESASEAPDDEKNSKAEMMGDAVAVEKFNSSAYAKRSVHNSLVAARISESIEESVRLENSADAYGEVTELYSDEAVFSYCVTTYPSNTASYYNIKQSDGSDISINDIIKDDSLLDENSTYYFKSDKILVIITDGEEKEVIIDRG